MMLMCRYTPRGLAVTPKPGPAAAVELYDEGKGVS